MSKDIRSDIVERARAGYAGRVEAVRAYLAKPGPTRAERQTERIMADPVASELMARGYGKGVALEAIREVE